MANSGCAVGGMIAVGMCYGNPLHERRQIAVVFRPEQQVPVVAHNAIAANPHAGSSLTFVQNVFKSNEIARRFEYSQPAISSIHDMIIETANCLSFGLGHDNFMAEIK